MGLAQQQQAQGTWASAALAWYAAAAAAAGEEAAAGRALNPLHTCHSASQQLSQPQGTSARGRRYSAGSTKGLSGFPTKRSGP